VTKKGHPAPPPFCHSDPERSEGEESLQETLRAKALRVTEERGHSFADPSLKLRASAQGSAQN